ncbi:MAG: TenA family protein [Austwickia sp.]|jgi:thiaminase/transcriptional activator TenA|nr:MAG: TenA family protein [Austwickia sp.]
MTFSSECWEAIAPVRAAIDAHPFLRGLEDGTLDRDLFVGYMAQDAIYLDAYARALAAAAAQAPTPDEVVFWATSAREAILVERELHAGHVADFAAAVASPTTTAYTNHLLGLAAGGCYEALAAGLLPCFWIYEDVGTRLKDRVTAARGGLDGHAFGDWIGQYGDPAFAQTTREAVALVDRLAQAAREATRTRMRAAFVTASRYEWMFWDAAHRAETWPV